MAERRDDQGGPGGIEGVLEYSAALFDHSTAESIAACLERVLRAVVVDPDVRVGDVPLLSGVEFRRLLVEWNATGADESGLVDVVARVRELAVERPGAVAVSDGEGRCRTASWLVWSTGSLRVWGWG
ncbi:hypothetical protein ACOT81_32765 [Streptomyces sp. WI04-05B]|uniref:hypothetical protein n=1 Tax=Streptomyces echiniscabiei TaxID=3028708 RepID=UPI003B9D1783